MALGAPVQLRLEPEKQLIYEAEASARWLTLVGYLRQRLEERDMMHSELIVLQNQVSGLRQLVERLVGRQGDTPSQASASAQATMLTELVLLLRNLSKPSNMQVVHGEMKRLGIPIWHGEKGGNDVA